MWSVSPINISMWRDRGVHVDRTSMLSCNYCSENILLLSRRVRRGGGRGGATKKYSQDQEIWEKNILINPLAAPAGWQSRFSKTVFVLVVNFVTLILCWRVHISKLAIFVPIPPHSCLKNSRLEQEQLFKILFHKLRIYFIFLYFVYQKNSEMVTSNWLQGGGYKLKRERSFVENFHFGSTTLAKLITTLLWSEAATLQLTFF